MGIIAAVGFLRKQVENYESCDYCQVYCRAQEYQFVRRGGFFKSFNHALRLIQAYFFVKPSMKNITAYIIALAAFGAFFLLMDIFLFNAQGLSFLYRG